MLFWLTDFAADLRYAQRTLRRSPGFLLTAVLSLALGIGANAAIFTALDAALWKPLPVGDPTSLVRFTVSRVNREDRNSLPEEFARDLQGSGVFSDILSFSADGFSFTYDGRAERIQGEVVSPNYFSFLRLKPYRGEGFSSEVRSGRWAAETVLSYRFWMRRFGGDPSVIGRTIHVNTYPFTIVGVSSPGFHDVEQGYDPDLRMPVLPAGQEMKESQMLSGGIFVAMARLAPGVSMAQAGGVTDSLFQNLLRTTTSPEIRRAGFLHVRVWPGAHGLSGDLVRFKTPLLVLLGLVGIVLLIACANFAGLLLARATARRRELVMRASIGAARGRLVRQMVTESLLIALLGGALAVPVANWAGAVLLGFLPQGHQPLTVDLRPDARAFAFTLCLSVLTGLIFGLIPALQATRGDLAGRLREDSAGAVGGGSRLRQLLVVTQVAFSVVLLIAAGAFIRSLTKLQTAEYAAIPDHVLLFTMKPQQEIYSPDRVRAVTSELVRRVSALPGVTAAGLAENGPLGSRSSREFVEGPGSVTVQADDDDVTPGFFSAVGMRSISGRDFTDGDNPSSRPVAIVNQALARALFPNQNPIGRTIAIPRRKATFEIVGVVADARYYNLHNQPAPGIWFAIQQDIPYMPTLHVRSSGGNTAGVVAAVRREFDAIDRGFPVFNIKTLQLRIDDSLAGERMVADLSSAFGILAMLLAAIGLFGVLAYSVSRRTREIGIRVALGSSRVALIWMTVREALLLVAAGTAAGVIIAGAASRVFSVQGLDGATLSIAALAMLIIGAMAVAIPAARACRIDPMRALRSE
jgi:predicted permease